MLERIVHHGTATSFDSFDLAHAGENTGYPGADRAIFFAGSAADADHYAQLSASQTGGEARTIRARITASNPLIIGLNADDSSVSDDILDAIADDDNAAFDYAEENGFDAVVWPHGNMNNAAFTVAVLDERHIQIID